MTTEDTPKPDTAPDNEETRQTKQPAQEPPVHRDSWIKVVLKPVLLLTAGILLIVALGAAQKLGWISAGGGGGGGQASTVDANVRYICPMMCTPPQTEPGRCPVCAMELVPASSGGGNSDGKSIRVDPAARRVANIRTAAVKSTICRIVTGSVVSYPRHTLATESPTRITSIPASSTIRA